MNCVQILLQVAGQEPSQDKRYTIQAAAHLLEAAIQDFTSNPNLENLRNLNGVWAYAYRVLALATPPQPEAGKAVA